MHAILPQTARSELEQWLLDTLPKQGHWSVEDYLWITDRSNHPVEYNRGNLEFLPMPTDKHHTVLKYLFMAFLGFVEPRGGNVHFNGIRLQVLPNLFREPDLLLFKDAHDPRRQNRFWTGADLTLEVVSEDKPERDLVVKRHEYAQGSVPEYWIVNPFEETITVLKLEGTAYVEHGVVRRGATATSVVLPGFQVDVSAVFDAK